ncbi:MAG: molybdopterin-dependent oxidoreductase [Dethiobacter sp.]|nr:molybdopterin-dependent oxidoreductase [Dethiobacter sp.]
MQQVTITLNKRVVSGHEGMTVLDLAQEAGVDIPTLCHDAHLTPVGACRLCMVENEKTGALLASCVTPIFPGMEINTGSPRVIAHRKMIVKLLLASHPDSCVVCDKGNRCRLRQIAADLGVGHTELERIPQPALIKEVNPYISRDLSKCILCAKCIRACQELVVEGVVDYFHRGFKAQPATFGEESLEKTACTFCGTCVAVCPTGALMERESIYQGTTRTAVTTTCPFCGCGCSVRLEIRDNRVVRATPGKNEGSDRGALCVRGSYGLDFIHSAGRLTKPLVRDGDGFREVPWDVALAAVASGLQRVRGTYGHDSLAVLGSSKCTNEENYLLQMFTRKVLGTNSIDNSASLYNAATREGLGGSVGLMGTTNHLGALEQSDVIIAIGTDADVSAPQASYAIKRAVKFKSAKLIVIDPRRTKLTEFAHVWLRPKFGTDVILLNALAGVIIGEGLLDAEFVARKTANYELLPRALEKYTPEYAEKMTGVPREQIREAARLYARAARSSVVYGTGITKQARGSDSIKALANLALLTGNVWCRGCGIYALQKENNGQGACDMGAIPDFFPGYQRLAGYQTRRRFEKRWQVSLPSKPGMTATEMFWNAKDGKIRGMYVVGENPVVGWAQADLVRDALSALDFLVVQDIFLTETAKMAHVVLPAASFAEKSGTFTNFEGRIGRVRQAVDPVGESLPDWQIILKLSEKMGDPLPFSTLEQVIEEIEEFVPLYEGYCYEDGRFDDDWCFWEQRRESSWQHLSGFARFSAVGLDLEAEPDGYPYTLVLEPSLFHFGSGARTAGASRLNRHAAEAFLAISPSDTERLSVATSDRVRIVSPVAELAAVVKIDGNLPEGTVSLPASFPGANRLFSLEKASGSTRSSLNTCNVRIERNEQHG